MKEELNKNQLEAVNHLKWALLILAGAGSGKTKTLTFRIYNLLKNWVKPWEILAVTFTNKAWKEMKERVQNLLSKDSADFSMPFIWTFHSFCLRILRAEIWNLWFTSNFLIYDMKDQQTAMKIVLENMNLEVSKNNPKKLLKTVSNYKNTFMSPDFVEKHYKSAEWIFCDIYKNYQKFLKQNNAVDFDDILFFAVKLLKDFPEILKKYSEKYKYISIDEYQDTNHVQYLFMKLLSQKHWNICCIWDSDQSIYSFRWADISNILNFEKDFENCKVIKLETNYRSSQNILDVANSVISNNKSRHEKKMIAFKWKWEEISVELLPTEKDESMFIASEISNKVRQWDFTYKDFTVLYRTNAQSRIVEEFLVQYWIPYKIIWGLKFYDRKEIKDILAYFKVIFSEKDSVALSRVINVPSRKIWKTSFTKLQNHANSRSISVWEILKHIEMIEWISKPTKQRIFAFYEMIKELRKAQKKMNISDFIDLILEKTWYNKMLKNEDSVESASRLDNLQELKSVLLKFDEFWESSLWRFLEEVSLVADSDWIETSQDVVNLMTIHSSKGLEFENVFLIWMEEWVFPSMMSFDDEFQMEEERRLAYTGITRAKHKLYLLRASSRLLYWNFQNNPASRFLDETWLWHWENY